MVKKRDVSLGCIRIKTNLNVYKKTSSGWKLSGKKFPSALQIIYLFKAHHNLSLLIDQKNPSFLKGQLSSAGKPVGARINVLPDGEKLAGAYSLFAEKAVIHDEKSNEHWDVMYKNPSGNCYVYALKKKNLAVKNKYQKVKEFAKAYPIISQKVSSALKKNDDQLAIPMYTLLKTQMRIGNEIYYKAHGHKGLTTLKKKDVSINGNQVTFTYLAKDGIPLKLTETFPSIYVKKLSCLLKPLKNSSFIFVTKKGRPLTDTHFKEAFKRYCGKEFYPHIVRSYYATSKVEDFLKNKRHPSKKEVDDLFISIARKLGHKKYMKEKNQWEDNYNTTIHYYVQPNLIDKVKNRIK